MSHWDSIAAGTEQAQKANCEMSGYEVAAAGAPDFAGHLPETSAVPQGSGAPASLARACWAEQVQQPEALVVQEATVSPSVVRSVWSEFQALVLPLRDGHGFAGH